MIIQQYDPTHKPSWWQYAIKLASLRTFPNKNQKIIHDNNDNEDWLLTGAKKGQDLGRFFNIWSGITLKTTVSFNSFCKNSLTLSLNIYLYIWQQPAWIENKLYLRVWKPQNQTSAKHSEILPSEAGHCWQQTL